MSRLDVICQRIRIAHPSDGEGPGRSYSTPRWTEARVQEIKTMSPILKVRIDELERYPESEPWYVDPEFGDGIDRTTAYKTLDIIGAQNVTVQGTPSNLSDYCSGLWYFEIIPRRFPSCRRWTATDDNNHIISRTQQGGNQVPPGWCWHNPVGHRSRETCLHLANSALVLGWKEVFKREIRTIIWDWTETSPNDFLTPVKRLMFGPSDGLKNRRIQEKKAVIEYMHQYFDRRKGSYSASVKQTSDELRDHGMVLHEPDEFREPSIYQMLNDIEHIILPQRRASIASQIGTYTVGTIHRPSTRNWSGKLKALESRLEAWLSRGDTHKDFARDMFDAVHAFIEMRQTDLANEILAWRDDEIAKWEKHF
ncbi:hypothetical protein B0T17DRAFT_527864 [Bombardia bombarda]|uniref:Uncharacterized protein n=1 Tax=Bombardia bombarda TaxID=252184 RepID=A0AA39XA86_9PEZI|nr:hypothetical protein B0T17DRAFT_527864 [Bombardia bombarda]